MREREPQRDQPAQPGPAARPGPGQHAARPGPMALPGPGAAALRGPGAAALPGPGAAALPGPGQHAARPASGPPGTLPRPGQPSEPFRHEVLAVVLRARPRNLEVLLWRRGEPPFEGRWSLPGGPLGARERLGTSASRHLATKVDLTVIAHLEQLETRSDPERDPRGRILATAYLALVSAEVEPRVPADTAWHPAADLPPTAFDHGSIVGSAIERLRAKLSYTNIGFALAPETFTIAQLRDVYAAALGHPVSATNLQRILTRRGVIVATSAAARPTALGGRPATLYRFAAQTLVVTNPFAAFRPPTLVGPTGRAPRAEAGQPVTSGG